MFYENQEKIAFEKDKQFIFYEKWSEKPEKQKKKPNSKQSYFSNFFATDFQPLAETRNNIE